MFLGRGIRSEYLPHFCLHGPSLNWGCGNIRKNDRDMIRLRTEESLSWEVSARIISTCGGYFSAMCGVLPCKGGYNSIPTTRGVGGGLDVCVNEYIKCMCMF
jgi:hypothetical protein